MLVPAGRAHRAPLCEINRPRTLSSFCLALLRPFVCFSPWPHGRFVLPAFSSTIVYTRPRSNHPMGSRSTRDRPKGVLTSEGDQHARDQTGPFRSFAHAETDP